MVAAKLEALEEFRQRSVQSHDGSQDGSDHATGMQARMEKVEPLRYSPHVGVPF